MADQRPCATDYRILALIGKGSFSGAVISMAKHVPSDQTVAVKVIDLETSPLPFSLIQHEIKMHRVFRHKNILPILFSFLHRNEVWTVLPCTSYGSCQDIMHAHFTSGLPETAIAYIIRDVLQGLNYLHSRAVIHRSVKSCHILVHADGTACLSGLRHCFSMLSNGRRLKAVHDFPDHYNNNLNWASRELLEQNLSGYNTKSDIYSLGITICEIANGVVPFQDMPLTQMLLSKIEGKTPRLLDVTTIPELVPEEPGIADDVDGITAQKTEPITNPFMRTLTPAFHSLTENCLHWDPAYREPAARLLTHQFFKQIKKKANPRPLSELLRPLNPVTEHSVPPSYSDDINELTNTIEDLAMDTTEWMF